LGPAVVRAPREEDSADRDISAGEFVLVVDYSDYDRPRCSSGTTAPG
jgi:hypothetical protein